KMEKRRQSPNESVMTYYHDKLQLFPHVIRRHPVSSADFLIIAQDEEKIQLTLNELRHASINSPDTYSTDDGDPIDGIVSLVNRSTNPYTRS
ncbi:unnamed protein product, partial [Rotaria sp. Silwood1]